MEINWKLRLKNKNFWLSAIPAALLVAQAFAAIFGYTLEVDDFGAKLLVFVNAVFALLTITGIVNDPTTTGLNDSSRAMSYREPK
ncbi:holin [Streptococcus phage Javan249]|uniref:phage holin n=1 Tax=Streptococcus TaxID=1301 RepID=UPI000788E28E|nr:phage holin [Streptococcus halotolerans]QBX16415.1 holin [Streptococcus phage Javan249]